LWNPDFDIPTYGEMDFLPCEDKDRLMAIYFVMPSNNLGKPLPWVAWPLLKQDIEKQQRTTKSKRMWNFAKR